MTPGSDDAAPVAPVVSPRSPLSRASSADQTRETRPRPRSETKQAALKHPSRLPATPFHHWGDERPQQSSLHLGARIADVRPGHGRPRVDGRFLVVDGEKLWVKGVTYGTFAADEEGHEFGTPDIVDR